MNKKSMHPNTRGTLKECAQSYYRPKHTTQKKHDKKKNRISSPTQKKK